MRRTLPRAPAGRVIAITPARAGSSAISVIRVGKRRPRSLSLFNAAKPSRGLTRSQPVSLVLKSLAYSARAVAKSFHLLDSPDVRRWGAADVGSPSGPARMGIPEPKPSPTSGIQLRVQLGWPGGEPSAPPRA